MSILTLELKNESDLKLLVDFAKRLNISILEIKKSKTINKQSPLYWLDKLANNGGVASISDPSAWQKEVRNDKPLLNRE